MSLKISLHPLKTPKKSPLFNFEEHVYAIIKHKGRFGVLTINSEGLPTCWDVSPSDVLKYQRAIPVITLE